MRGAEIGSGCPVAWVLPLFHGVARNADSISSHREREATHRWLERERTIRPDRAASDRTFT